MPGKHAAVAGVPALPRRVRLGLASAVAALVAGGALLSTRGDADPPGGPGQPSPAGPAAAGAPTAPTTPGSADAIGDGAAGTTPGGGSAAGPGLGSVLLPGRPPAATTSDAPRAGAAPSGATPTATGPTGTGPTGTGPAATRARRLASASPAEPAGGPLTASYVPAGGDETSFVAGVTVTNPGPAAQRWTVVLAFPPAVAATLTATWNATADARTGRFTFRGGPLAAGASHTFGFQAGKAVGVPAHPVGCTVNGAACA